MAYDGQKSILEFSIGPQKFIESSIFEDKTEGKNEMSITLLQYNSQNPTEKKNFKQKYNIYIYRFFA